MIPKLRKRFISLSMISICILLTVLVAGMNIISYRAMVRDADDTLQLLSQNRGRFPDMKNDFGFHHPRPMSPELPYESRFFSVVINAEGQIVFVDMDKIASIDENTARQYVEKVHDERGFVEDYRYLQSEENGGRRIVFLDCGRKLDSFRTFLWASVIMAVLGTVAALGIISFFAGRIVRPMAESYEKQKRFITDAGHELKTPLTVINANADILEMEIGEKNESLEDIRQQTKKLTKLTNDLVMLARMEEAEGKLQKLPFPMSEITAEAVQPFRALAQAQNKTLNCRIAPMVTLCGSSHNINRLVTVLMDNALKYTPEGGTIALELEATAKTATLSVTNTTDEELSPEELSHLFERFYRADASRNSGTGGHGIGLSVAQAIVNNHGGKIQAGAKDGTFRIRAIFPI